MTSTTDEFDTFYADARGPMLLETFALTGDLAAGRSAVRDAFVVTWHHWRKATRKDDPYNWMRPFAWSRAGRNHQIHIWRKDPHLPEVVEELLAELDKLSTPGRKALVLRHLSSLDMPDLARVVGLPLEETERELARATVLLTNSFGIDEDELGDLLDELSAVTDQVTWPRATMIRRTGAARRRSHTVLGAVGAAAILVLGGSLVARGDHPAAELDAGRITGSVEVPAGRDAAPEPPKLLAPDSLLKVDQVASVAPTLAWQETLTTDNSGEEPTLAPCQPARFADMSGLDTFVRQFDATGPKKQSATVIESVELSRTPEAAARTYQRVQRWFGNCANPRTQLTQTMSITGVGAEGMQFRYRTWTKSPETFTVSVARTGRLTMTTVDVMRKVRKAPTPEQSAQLLADAVTGQCTGSSAELATECATAPVLTPVEPLSLGRPRGMLREVDLPPVSGAKGSWLGTKASISTDLLAPSQCARVPFGNATPSTRSRQFLFPKMPGEKTFGLTQVTSVMPSGKAAKKFTATLRDQIATCEKNELGTSVRELVSKSTKKTDLAVWVLTVELSDDASTHYLLGTARNGTRVTQVGLVPSERLTVSDPDFTELTRRALERLPRFREKSGA